MFHFYKIIIGILLGATKMDQYYIVSNSYSLRERFTKKGKVYDIVFRVITSDGVVKQKTLCRFQTKTKAKQGYISWIQQNCTAGEPPEKKKVNIEKEDVELQIIIKKYLFYLHNQNKASTIIDKKTC